jgi:hypothetical protein
MHLRLILRKTTTAASAQDNPSDCDGTSIEVKPDNITAAAADGCIVAITAAVGLHTGVTLSKRG